MLATVGRTPWSARVPLDPLFVQPHQRHATHKRPTGGSAVDQRGSAPAPQTGWQPYDLQPHYS